MSVSFCLPHPVAVSAFMICRGLCACTEMLWMCVLYVSFGSKVRPRTFGCVAMGSALLFIVRSRLLVYSAGSGVNRVQVVLSGFNKRLFCFVQAKTLCRYGCKYFFLHHYVFSYISFLDCPCHIATPETINYQQQVTTYTTSPLVNPLYKYCALNRVCLHSLQYSHHCYQPLLHHQSFVKKANSPFSYTSTKLLHCWCHKY